MQKSDGLKLDSIVSFKASGREHKLGIINHPAVKEGLAAEIEADLKAAAIEGVLIVCRDETHQQTVQAALANSSVSKRCFFSTHHELYKTGIAPSSWQGADKQCANLFMVCLPECRSTAAWSNAALAIA